MSKEDYQLLINICYHCLRYNNLTMKQISDINTMIDKLYKNLCKIKNKEHYALERN